MDHCVLAGPPTPAFIAKFERAVVLLGQYSLQELNLTRQDMARKAVSKAEFIEQEPNQHVLAKMVLAYQATESQHDRLMIIESAWNLYNNT